MGVSTLVRAVAAIAAVALTLTTSVNASPTRPGGGGSSSSSNNSSSNSNSNNRDFQCQNLTIPVTITARNAIFDVATPETNIQVTNFILNLAQQGHNYSAATLKEYADVSGTYELAATYCAPSGGSSKTLQILTHGVGFDRSYWDIPLNDFNYSYVASAVGEHGFSTLSWDRLGIGASSHGEPVNEIQATLEIAALKELTRLARARQIPGLPQQPAFDKVVHVGHSFGSIQSFELARQQPDLSDGLILTGFGVNGSFLPYFQFGGNFVSVTTVPALASQYVAGYFGAGNPSAVQTNFFSPGQFDPAALELAAGALGQPVTVGELFTIGSAIGGVSQFSGPVLVITGERDLPFCGGDCLATGDPAVASIPAGVQALVPNSKGYETFIVPKAGHGLNFEYSAQTTYQHIGQFLAGNGFV